MLEEVWKIYPLNNKFSVSSFGKLKNSLTGKIYSQHKSKSGYMGFCTSNGKRKSYKLYRIHRMVAETFIPNPDNKPYVNHKDGNKTNNNVSNLEWVTASENTKHAFETGLCKIDRRYKRKLSDKDVTFIREKYIPRHPKYGARPLSRRFGTTHQTIRDIILNNTYKE